MNALDDVLKRVDDAVARLEKVDAAASAAPDAPRLRGEIEALTMRVDAALMKARAVHAALD
jgi:hypothetical protein